MTFTVPSGDAEKALSVLAENKDKSALTSSRAKRVW